jgi:hypothetical protein
MLSDTTLLNTMTLPWSTPDLTGLECIQMILELLLQGVACVCL